MVLYSPGENGSKHVRETCEGVPLSQRNSKQESVMLCTLGLQGNCELSTGSGTLRRMQFCIMVSISQLLLKRGREGGGREWGWWWWKDCKSCESVSSVYDRELPQWDCSNMRDCTDFLSEIPFDSKVSFTVLFMLIQSTGLSLTQGFFTIYCQCLFIIEVLHILCQVYSQIHLLSYYECRCFS